MGLHDQCQRIHASIGLSAYAGHIVTRVDGGWLMTRYFQAKNGINLRETAFVAELEAPNQYAPASIFDMSLNDEITLGLTNVPEYDLLVKAVPGGWNYYHLVSMKNGVNTRLASFVPRAKRWNTTTFVADGTDSLDTGIAELADAAESEVEVYVGNGARRFLSASSGRQDDFTVSGSVINWEPGRGPYNGEDVTLRLYEILSK